MVYSNKFVVCVLVNGRPAKERADGIVAIPFGSEYVLRFRNKNDRRAVVKFTIDGENVSGNGYIIPAHSAIDIKRHSEIDRSFKFVNLNSEEAIEQRKNGPNDGNKGVIVANFYLEKEIKLKIDPYLPITPVYPYPIYPYPNPWYDYQKNPINDEDNYYNYPKITCSYNNGIKGSVNYNNTQNFNVSNFESKSLQDGATVEGFSTGQNFTTQYIDYDTNYVTIRLVLKGIEEKFQEVKSEEIYFCTNCGVKKSRKKDNFCGICGQKL